MKEREIEEKRKQLVKDLKQYCIDNPDNCEAEKRGVASLDPNNWYGKAEDVRALGIGI